MLVKFRCKLNMMEDLHIGHPWSKKKLIEVTVGRFKERKCVIILRPVPHNVFQMKTFPSFN